MELDVTLASQDQVHRPFLTDQYLSQIMILAAVDLLKVHQLIMIFADVTKWIISTSTVTSEIHLAHLGSNHPMALVFVGKVLVVLSNVMNHCKSLPYLTATA